MVSGHEPYMTGIVSLLNILSVNNTDFVKCGSESWSLYTNDLQPVEREDILHQPK
jgi:hypothetical protein